MWKVELNLRFLYINSSSCCGGYSFSRSDYGGNRISSSGNSSNRLIDNIIRSSCMGGWFVYITIAIANVIAISAKRRSC